MCIPKPEVSAPAPSPIQSLESATGLEIGGAPRGAAQLGRLKLRLGGAAPAAPTKRTSVPISQSLGFGQPTGVAGSFQSVPNSDLRLPIGI